MDRRLQNMLDHHEITRVLTEYCHGCDRCDERHMASVYWDDSWDDHGVHKAPGPQYARIAIPEIRDDTQVLSHHLGQSLIDVDGDKAGAETYFIAVTRTTSTDGRQLCNQLGGRYVDRFERREGVWKIKNRVTVRDWSVSLKVEEDVFALAQLTPGRRSADDPSCRVLSRPYTGLDREGFAV